MRFLSLITVRHENNWVLCLYKAINDIRSNMWQTKPRHSSLICTLKLYAPNRMCRLPGNNSERRKVGVMVIVYRTSPKQVIFIFLLSQCLQIMHHPWFSPFGFCDNSVLSLSEAWSCSWYVVLTAVDWNLSNVLYTKVSYISALKRTYDIHLPIMWNRTPLLNT